MHRKHKPGNMTETEIAHRANELAKALESYIPLMRSIIEQDGIIYTPEDALIVEETINNLHCVKVIFE